MIHSEHDEIRPHGKCDFFKEGEATGERQRLSRHGDHKGGILEVVGLKALGLVTKKQSGYIPHAEGEYLS